MAAFSFFCLIALLLCFSTNPTTSDPQTKLLLSYCGQSEGVLYDPLYTESINRLTSNLNATLSDLRSQLINSVRFVTAQPPNIYALFQCRDYLSLSDCLSCFSAAASEAQTKCTSAPSFKAIYDGCFLRYRIDYFFQQATDVGNMGSCGDREVQNNGGDFNRTAEMLLRDLVEAAPRSREFFVAAKREGAVGGSRDNDIVYGVAQCAHTVTKSGCQECLETAYGNIKLCLPSADGRAVDVGCFLRYSHAAFFRDDQVTDVAALPKEKRDQSKKAIIIGIGVGVALFLVIVVLLLHLWRKARKALQGDVIGATELRGAMNFNYQELKSATKNFSEESKVGKGGFGTVYLGVLKDGKKVAIKKLVIEKSRQIEEDFEKEVKLMNNVHHWNLVQLLGCCRKGTEYLLVYEYMANSSLDKYLFGNQRGTLNWKQRFDIIVGIARGLAYLHEEFDVCIIHRDIKSNNILLDDEFQPKIADFGLARLFPSSQSHLKTRFAGTLGYMAPEYALLGKLTEKIDVYSYGMVVLEMVSGRKSSEIRHEPITEYLLNWAWRLYEEGILMELVDQSLDPNEYEKEEVRKVIKIALMCTQSSASRPAMSEVVVWLLNNDQLEFTLTPPKFINATNPVQKRVPQKDASTSSSLKSTHATMSITRLSAR